MDNTNNSCCCGETEHFSGCLICGAPVTYSVESSVKTCSICHKEQLTNAVCENGHFVCDACHSYGTYIPVIIALRSSTEKDPLLLLEEIMDLPSVHMHGPEHHAIVPSVLLTALRNNGERMNYDTALSEICKRARQVPGGTCGYWGVCGAAAGAGIFMSVMQGPFLRSLSLLFYPNWLMLVVRAAVNAPAELLLKKRSGFTGSSAL